MKSIRVFYILIMSVLVSTCASTDGVSFSGRFIREGMKTFMQGKSLGKNGLFEKGRKNAEKPSKWKVPADYKLTKFIVDSVPMELLETRTGSQKVILQLHGGAYVIGLSDAYRIFALKYCKISGGASILSINYRLAPEHVFPTALLDALTAWNWLISHGYKPENILVAGDSAGGNLALALVEWLRDKNEKLPAGIVLMSPWADLSSEGESHLTNLYKDPLFGQKPPKKGQLEIQRPLARPAYAGSTNLYDKFLSPVYAEYDHFPPMLIQVGTYEVLESDAINVAEKAQKAGVDVTLSRYEGMFHVFQHVQFIPESKRAWKEVENFIGRRLNVK
jgi:epsilon-lactone hydrolase